MTTLTLNQCLELSDGVFFYPKIQRTSTQSGDLTVTPVGPGVLFITERYSSATFTYRFEYSVRIDEKMQRLFNLSTKQFFAGIKAFSGSVNKYSDVLDRFVAWEMVPLKGRFPRVKFDCDATLDGLPEQ